MNRLDFVEKDNQRRDLPPFRVGDTVRVHVRVTEGEKTRIQVFEGVVLRRRGHSTGESFTVRKISNGVGVERIFPVQSPAVTKVEIKSRGHVRRARLYYLRELSGKKARLHSKVRDLSGLISDEERDAQGAAAAPAATATPAVEVESDVDVEAATVAVDAIPDPEATLAVDSPVDEVDADAKTVAVAAIPDDVDADAKTVAVAAIPDDADAAAATVAVDAIPDEEPKKD
jgi:large subunit ribosomal protein L19